METTPRVNPLKDDAVTADTVQMGDHLIVWRPGDPDSRIEVTITSEVYYDDDSTMIIDATQAGRESTFSTSELGLTANRHTGQWTRIAIINEEGEEDL